MRGRGGKGEEVEEEEVDASLFVPNLFGNVFDYLHRKIPHHILVHNRISRSCRRCPSLSILRMFHECTHESHRDLMRKMKSKNYYSNYIFMFPFRGVREGGVMGVTVNHLASDTYRKKEMLESIRSQKFLRRRIVLKTRRFIRNNEFKTTRHRMLKGLNTEVINKIKMQKF